MYPDVDFDFYLRSCSTTRTCTIMPHGMQVRIGEMIHMQLYKLQHTACIICCEIY